VRYAAKVAAIRPVAGRPQMVPPLLEALGPENSAVRPGTLYARRKIPACCKISCTAP